MQFNIDEQLIVRMCGSITDQVGDGCTDDKMHRFRMFLQELPNTKRHTAVHPYQRMTILVTASIAVIAVALYMFQADDKASPFWIGDAKTAGVIGEHISATNGKSRTVRFENDSTFKLRDGSTAVVTACNRDNVNMRLLDGDVEASVIGNGKTKWTVTGGPFSVVVVGTHFNVAWDKKGEVFDVKVTKGGVRIEGISYADGGINVAKGYRLRIDRRAHTLALSSSDGSSPETTETTSVAFIDNSKGVPEARWQLPSESIEPEPRTSIQQQGVAKSPVRKTKWSFNTKRKQKIARQKRRIRKKVRGANDDIRRNKGMLSLDPDGAADDRLETRLNSKWLELYEQGDHSQALREAESIGIEKLLSDLSLNHLWQLMHAARSVGRYSIAKAALYKCRERFPTSKKAILSSFYLGKIEYEKVQNFYAAIRWFSTYLKESPSGQLSEEAEGRIMIAHEKLGNLKRARELAHDYLKKFPKGLFSVHANALLGG